MIIVPAKKSETLGFRAKAIISVSIIIVISIILVYVFHPSIRKQIFSRYIHWKYPIIPWSELSGEIVYSRYPDGSEYYVSNDRQIYKKGPTAKITYQNGEKEIRYLGKVTKISKELWRSLDADPDNLLLASIQDDGLAIDYRNRKIALTQDNETIIIKVNEFAQIKRHWTFIAQNGEVVRVDVNPISFEEIREDDTIQYIEEPEPTVNVIGFFK